MGQSLARLAGVAARERGIACTDGDDAADREHHRAPPPHGRTEQVEHDAHEGVDRDLGHHAAHQRGDVARRRRVGERQKEIVSGFPDALDLMLVCVEAGQSLDQSIIRLGKESRAGYPALAGSYQVRGATLALQLPDGRVAVVNCDSKTNWTEWSMNAAARALPYTRRHNEGLACASCWWKTTRSTKKWPKFC